MQSLLNLVLKRHFQKKGANFFEPEEMEKEQLGRYSQYLVLDPETLKPYSLNQQLLLQTPKNIKKKSLDLSTILTIYKD